MASRLITDLSQKMQELCRAHLDACSQNASLAMMGCQVILTCTYRSNIEQDQLYRQGRTDPGPIVTRAKGGQSAHNTYNNGACAEAYDVAPLINGKIAWDDHQCWAIIGTLGAGIGLKWYGEPDAPFREMPHFQNPDWRL